MRNRKKMYKKALGKWGIQSQVMMFFEEISELTKAICKNHRGEKNLGDILEELADVEIMLEQLKIIFIKDDELFKDVKNDKLKRLKEILEY